MRKELAALGLLLCLSVTLSGCKEDPTTNATVAPQEAAAVSASPGATPTPTPSPEKQ